MTESPTLNVELRGRIVQAPGEVDAWRFRVVVGGRVVWGDWFGSEQQARIDCLEFAQRHGRELVLE
jgi:hypothetical protein